MIGATALGLLAGQVVAQETPTTAKTPPQPSVVTNPDWLRKPTIDDLRRLYPAKAWAARMGGAATIQCSVTAEGTLTACSVVSEGPENYGFGAAALAMAPEFKMQPKLADGRPVAGGTVRIPLIFHSPDGRTMASLLENPPWRRTPSAAAIAAAYPREAAELDGGTAVVRCGFEFDGRAGKCTIRSQSPAGKGFGPAAKTLAEQFVVRSAGLPPLAILLADIPFTFRNPARPQSPAALKPHWVVGLSASGVEKVFPAAARAAGVTNGLGVVSCAVGEGGEMVDCQAQREDPAGLGFGVASAEAAKLMVMNPWSAEGESLVGRRLNLPIRLRLEGATSAAPSATSP